jgi:hypothetical protein
MVEFKLSRENWRMRQRFGEQSHQSGIAQPGKGYISDAVSEKALANMA